MATLGNRPDLFPDSPYVNKYITGKPGDYEVPGEYLDDETFAAMLAEAQKYIGYPYAVSYTHLVKVHEDGSIERVMKYGDIYALTVQSIKEVQEAM